MTLQLSVAVRNAQANALESTAGASAKLQIRTGDQPANCAAAATGTLLAELDLPADWLGAASSGSVALAGSWTGNAVASGTAGHFRIVDNAGTTCHAQGDISDDLALTPTTVTAGQTVTVSSFTYTRGNA